jgi:hypothetical protein
VAPRRIPDAAWLALSKLVDPFTRSEFIRNPNCGQVTWSHLIEDGIIETTSAHRSREPMFVITPAGREAITANRR